MTTTRRLVLNLVLATLAGAASTDSRAFGESLGFAAGPGDHILAVVSGQSGTRCNLSFGPPTSIGISGNVITIVSPPIPPCLVPGAPLPYRRAADLGVLPLPSYQVTWSAGAQSTSAVLSTAAFAHAAIPALSGAALALLAAGVALAAVATLHGGARRTGAAAVIEGRARR